MVPIEGTAAQPSSSLRRPSTARRLQEEPALRSFRQEGPGYAQAHQSVEAWKLRRLRGDNQWCSRGVGGASVFACKFRRMAAFSGERLGTPRGGSPGRVQHPRQVVWAGGPGPSGGPQTCFRRYSLGEVAARGPDGGYCACHRSVRLGVTRAGRSPGAPTRSGSSQISSERNLHAPRGRGAGRWMGQRPGSVGRAGGTKLVASLIRFRVTCAVALRCAHGIRGQEASK